MANKFLNGIGGTIVVNTLTGSAVTLAVKKWSGKKTAVKHDRTHAGSAGWQVVIPGTVGMAGSGECYLDFNALPDSASGGPLNPAQHLSGGVSDPDKYYAAVRLNVGNSGLAYTMANALISELEIVSSTDEGCTFSFTFDSSGPVVGPA